jgi:mono/diheme cytochrome c family protein
MLKRILLLASGMTMVAAVAAAQQKKVKHVPVKPTSAASGEQMYNSYCAACHGKDGKGGGPAAAALKTAPTDLTTLAQKNGGKSPQTMFPPLFRVMPRFRPMGLKRCRSGAAYFGR